MITELSLNDFIREFEDYNRDNYSYKGYELLYNYLNEIDENFKLDVIAVCCDFCEYENVEEFLKDHNTDLDKKDYEDIEDFYTDLEEEINNNTTLLKFDNDLNEGFVIGCY